MKEKVEYAYAKVNLTLEVLSKREDGYHELRSVFLPLQFHDFIQVRAFEGNQDITLISPYYRLNNQKNLMYKAAKLILTTYQLEYNVEIEYTKEIPSQAGLGGGSADAAAVMRALVEIFHLRLSDDEIIKLCEQIGADVPFCYFNQPALVEGVGNKLTFFENTYDCHVVLIKPAKGASTKRIFNQMKISQRIDKHHAIEMKKGLENNDYKTISQNLVNDLEIPAFKLVPEIEQIKNEVKAEGIKTTVMSGSGSTVVCLIDNDHLAKRIVKQYRNRGYFAIQTKFLKEQ